MCQTVVLHAVSLKSSKSGKKSVNISISSSFASQKQFCCPVNAMGIEKYDAELQKSDAVAMTTEQPIKQMNSNLPKITSYIPPFNPRRILRRNLIRSVTDCKIIPSAMLKTGRELDDIVMEKQSPTLERIGKSIEKIGEEFAAAPTESTSRSHVDTKVHRHPSQTQEDQPQTDNEKRSDQLELKELKLHEASKEHTNNSFAAVTVDEHLSATREGQPQADNEAPSDQLEVKEIKLHEANKEHANDSFPADSVDTSELRSSKKRHFEWQDSNSEDEVDNEHYDEKRIKKYKKSNDESDLHPLLKYPELMAVEVNKTLEKYFPSKRIPGPQSYITIATSILTTLLMNNISDEEAIRKYIDAFMKPAKQICTPAPLFEFQKFL